MAEVMKVAVIDDDQSLRRSLVRVLTRAGLNVRVFASARSFLSACDVDDVSCVVSDLRMPEADGLQLQQALQRSVPHLAMVFLTGHGDVATTVTAMKAGAVDFLEKPVKTAILLEAIQRASDRSARARAASAQVRDLNTRFERLTPREREVFALVAAGLLNKQVAAELSAAEKTIKQHRGRVMDKMEAESLAALVLMAERLGVRPTSADFSRAEGRAGIREASDMSPPAKRTSIRLKSDSRK